MAERLLKKLVKDRKIKGIKVFSKGTCATGENITENAKIVLAEFGASDRDRKSIRLRKIESDVLYIAVTEKIKNQINGRVICIKDLIGCDVLDPYGRSIEVYRETAYQLDKANRVLLDKILNLRS